MAFAKLTQSEQPDWSSLVPPLVYDPPQLKKKWQPCCLGDINWMTRDSPVLHSFPCCLGQCIGACVLKPCCNKELKKISRPDEWFFKLMEAAKPGCPDFLKGIWWMKDNNVPEELMTFEDATFSPGPEIGETTINMIMYKNWSYGSSNAFGSILALMEAAQRLKATWIVHGQWIYLGETSFIYRLEEGDDLRRPDGTIPVYTPGVDMLRITYSGKTLQDMDTSKPFFQYLVRRVAYMDEAGRLQKTDAYDELLSRTQKPNVPGACCNYGLCNIPVDQYEEIWQPISDECYIEINK